MIKKIGLGVLLAGLIAILIVGGIIRTIDKTENVAEARGLDSQGNGYGQGIRTEASHSDDGISGEPASSGQGRSSGQGSGGQGQGQGGGGQGGGGGQQGASTSERQYANFEESTGDWANLTGTIVQVPADDQDLMIATGDGTQVKVGTGPGYMAAQGFHLATGEDIVVQGYWEDDELKAAQITRVSDGASITLRDELGRPAWSGSGRRATEQQGALGTLAQGRAEAPGGSGATGQADLEGWLVLSGWVVNADEAALVLETEEDHEVLVEGRPWRFAQEAGFRAAVGDQVSLTGFYEGDEFEVGALDNITTGSTIAIRQESGRPLWAGSGRRGG